MKSSLETEKIKVGILCPCPIEYKTCCNILDLSNETELAGRAISSKRRDDIDLFAIKAGPGKIQSASATQLVIDNFRPDCVIDVGGAGALSNELRIKDIVCVKNAFEYDIFDLEEFSKWASFLTTSTLLTKLLSLKSRIMEEFSDWVASHSSTQFVIGDIACGEKIIAGGKWRQNLHEKLGAVACNWETSAVLKTAQLNSVHAFSFRVITDMAGKDCGRELQANWERALKILYPVLKEFIFHGWVHRIFETL